MDEIKRYDLMLEALAELKPEIDAVRGVTPVPDQPLLSEVLTEYGSMPREALFFGVASDRLPMLLNMHDPVPGPLLIVGDAGAGKTNLLQIVARAAGLMHQPEELQFGVMTNHAEEWKGFDHIPNNVGIFPFYQNSTQDFLLSLASWAHSNHSSKQIVLLLIDDLEAAANLDFDARQNLRWLLMRGPSRRVWPLVTVNPDRTDGIKTWVEAFHTRIFGSIQDAHRAGQFSADRADLHTLSAGTQFSMPDKNGWLRFWIPGID